MACGGMGGTHASPTRMAANDAGRRPGDDRAVGHLAAHDRTRGDHDVASDVGAGQHDRRRLRASFRRRC